MTMMNIWWHGRSWWQGFRIWQSQLGIWHKDHDDSDEADDNEEYIYDDMGEADDSDLEDGNAS